MEEKKIEKMTARCKTCGSHFEFLKSQRKNASYCAKACYNEFLKRKMPVQESITISEEDPNWMTKLFKFLCGK